MPRKTVEPQLKTERLSILDEDGRLDKDLEPDIEDEVLVDMYRWMTLTREFDDRMLRMQRQGRLGTFPPVRGQEASQIASCFQLRPNDWMVPSFREVGAMLHRGWKMEQILLFYAGYEDGSVPPEGVNDLPICIPVTSQLPHAVGLAWAARLKGADSATLCYLGDGATSEGDFHESMNFAAVFQAPVVFFCQNNGWAISLPVTRQTRSRSLAQKALAYEMPGVQVDGNDPLAVHAAVGEALQRARSGDGPTFIEALTYRMSVHTTADDPTRYRSDEEVAAWKRRDPLIRFERYLRQKELLDADGADALRREALEEIRAAVENAESLMRGDPLEMFDFLYAETPESILEQRRELEEFLKEAGVTQVVGAH